MKSYNVVLTEKLQKYQHYHQVKNYKYEYLLGEETLPPDQSRIIVQAKFNYSLLGKALEKQIKTIEDKENKIK